MKTYESFDDFWHTYQSESHNIHGFFSWQTVSVKHVSDQDYASDQLLARNTLGFQPMIVVEANPFLKEHRSSIVKHVNDNIFKRYQYYLRTKYIESFDKRINSFQPGAQSAYTEYPDWESFSVAWLDRPERPVYGENLILLIDHTPSIEYWTRKQMGEKTLPYQRLLVTTFHAATKQFYDFFVKDIDDQSAERILNLLKSRIYIHSETLFNPS